MFSTQLAVIARAPFYYESPQLSPFCPAAHATSPAADIPGPAWRVEVQPRQGSLLPVLKGVPTVGNIPSSPPDHTHLANPKPFVPEPRGGLADQNELPLDVSATFRDGDEEKKTRRLSSPVPGDVLSDGSIHSNRSSRSYRPSFDLGLRSHLVRNRRISAEQGHEAYPLNSTEDVLLGVPRRGSSFDEDTKRKPPRKPLWKTARVRSLAGTNAEYDADERV